MKRLLILIPFLFINLICSSQIFQPQFNKSNNDVLSSITPPDKAV